MSTTVLDSSPVPLPTFDGTLFGCQVQSRYDQENAYIQYRDDLEQWVQDNPGRPVSDARMQEVQKPEVLKSQTIIAALRKWLPVDVGGTTRLVSVLVNQDTGAIQRNPEFGYRYEVVDRSKLVWNCHEDELADILWEEHTRICHMKELILYKHLLAHSEGSTTIPGNVPRAVCKLFCRCCHVCNTHVNPGAGQKQYRRITSNWILERMQADCLFIRYRKKCRCHCAGVAVMFMSLPLSQTAAHACRDTVFVVTPTVDNNFICLQYMFVNWGYNVT